MLSSLRRTLWCAVGAFWSLAQAPVPLYAQTQYHLYDLGTFSGGNSYAAAINNQGVITGVSNHAFRHAGTGPLNLATDSLGNLGTTVVTTAINEAGTVVGAYSDGIYYGFRHTGPGPLNAGTDMLDTQYQFGSYAYAINNHDTSVGYASFPDGSLHAFRHTGAGPINFGAENMGAFGGNSSKAFGINDSDVMVGYAQTADGVLHAFRHSGSGVLTMATDDLGLVNGSSTIAQAINAVGDVAGYATINSVNYGFRHLGAGTINPATDLLGELAAGRGSTAVAINQSGITVGFAPMTDSIGHAFVFDTAIHDLNSLLDGSGSGWTVMEARGINDSGAIVGTGRGPSGQHAVLLVPLATPEPGHSALLLALVLAGGAAYIHRRGRIRRTRTIPAHSGVTI